MTRLYFPGATFRLMVTSIGNRELEPIQTHVLRAVSLGVDQLTDLKSMFGLTLRTTMELCNDLIRRNLLVVNFRQGKFHVPRQTLDVLQNGDGPARTLPLSGAAPPLRREVELTLNRCTGNLGRSRWLKPLHEQDRPLTSVVELTEIGDLDEAAVVTAANAILRQQGERVRDLNMNAAVIVREGGFVASYECVESDSTAADRASVVLVFDPNHRLPDADVDAMESLVLDLRRSHPWFWAALKPRVVEAGETAPDTGRTRLPSLGALANKISAGHGNCSNQEVMDVLDDAATLVDTMSEVRAIVGSAAISEEARTLVYSGRQAVIVCPFVNKSGSEWLSALQPSAAPVAVIHGINRVETETAAATLDELDVVSEPETGSETHAKVVIRGATDVLIGSKNLLSSPSTSPLFEVAVLASGPDIGPQALDWARRLSPSLVQRRLRWRPDQLGWTGLPTPSYPLPPVGQPSPGLLEILAALERLQQIGPQTSRTERLRGLIAGVKSWLNQTETTRSNEVTRPELAELVSTLELKTEEAGLAVAELVRTASHRRLVFQALERARTSVVITSHRLSTHALGPNFLSSLQSALARGVNITLLWGESDGTGTDELIDKLRSLAVNMPGKLVVNTTPLHIHCKLLIEDTRTVLVTSYELLHFAHTQHYERDELGVNLISPSMVKKLLRGLAMHITTMDASISRELNGIAAGDITTAVQPTTPNKPI